jgi:hypothetical protein
MIRTLKNTLAVVGSVCFVIGMQGFAIGGFSGQATPEAAKIASLGVDPVQNVVFLIAGWILLLLARRVARRSSRTSA